MYLKAETEIIQVHSIYIFKSMPMYSKMAPKNEYLSNLHHPLHNGKLSHTILQFSFQMQVKLESSMSILFRYYTLFFIQTIILNQLFSKVIIFYLFTPAALTSVQRWKYLLLIKRIVGLHKKTKHTPTKRKPLLLFQPIAGMDSACLFWINYIERSVTNCSHS